MLERLKRAVRVMRPRAAAQLAARVDRLDAERRLANDELQKLRRDVRQQAATATRQLEKHAEKVGSPGTELEFAL